MSASFILPSGNWFDAFKAHNETTVTFNYCDRRRNGQVARRYTVIFEKDTLKAVSITAVSADGGRVEFFSNCRALETAREIVSEYRLEQWAKKANNDNNNNEKVAIDTYTAVIWTSLFLVVVMTFTLVIGLVFDDNNLTIIGAFGNSVLPFFAMVAMYKDNKRE